ncbi:hypothetical protein FC83_GL003277 [Agrilactobacillus composti DSM 18527 = JCM 14202]|uniref:Gram-positive cocci surface proteins LPxTG domain-containing protein n=3 Tax=Agrilactobacillus TaxID=2767875 RepID=A0A0R1XSQ7_9LACO|nr:hypothetical protein FC83_GL003277 [Agrilactobacillus composti DSM 18527 = JCM 14202]
MWKSGKRWLVGAITATAFTAVGTALTSGNVVHAADTNVPVTTPVPDAKATSTTATAPSSVAPTTNATPQTTATSATPSTNSEAKPVTPAPESAATKAFKDVMPTAVSAATTTPVTIAAQAEAPASTAAVANTTTPAATPSAITPTADSKPETATPTNASATTTASAPAAQAAAPADTQKADPNADAVSTAPTATSADQSAAAKAFRDVMPTSATAAAPSTATNTTTLTAATLVAPASDATTPAATPDVPTPKTVNAIASDVRLLTGQTMTEAPASSTQPVRDFVRYGVAGKFSVNTSDLVSGNTIVVAPVTVTTNVPGAMPSFIADGPSVDFTTPDGAEKIGSGQYDNGLKAITLKVNNTITSKDPEMGLSFSAPWLMVLNYPRDIQRLNPLAPFTNTIEVSGHTYEAKFDAQTRKDATEWPGDAENLDKPRPLGVLLQTENITVVPDGTVLGQLQASNGTSADVLPNNGVTKRYLISSSSPDAILAPHENYAERQNVYVSSTDNKIQTVSEDLNYPDFSTDTGRLPITNTSVNAGDGQSLTQLTNSATQSGLYYSRQADGSYLTVLHITPADLVLTPDQIAAGVTSRYNGIGDLNKDIQATQKYYAGAMQNVTSRTYTSIGIDAVDPTKPITVTVKTLDASGNVTNTMQQTTLPNESDTVANSSQVITHYVDLKGNPLGTIDTQYGLPTGKETLTGPTSNTQASVSPKDFTGYKVVTDPSALTAAQQKTLQETLAKLGLSSATPEQVAGKNVFVVKANNVAFPGLNGTSYDANGKIVTDGGTPGTGETNAYYAYAGLPKDANVHWINLGDSKQTTDLTPASGTENTALAQKFAGFVGDNISEALKGTLPAKTHLVQASSEISTTNSPYTLTGIYNTDTSAPQDYYIYYAQDPETTTPGTTTPGTTTPGTTTPGTTTPGTTTPGTTTPGTTTPGTTTPGTTTPGTTTPGTTTPGTTTPGTTTPGTTTPGTTTPGTTTPGTITPGTTIPGTTTPGTTTPGTTTPGRPLTPGQPSTPGTPTTPSRPTTPGTPTTTPGRPSNPGTSTTPGKPANPGTTTPGKPANPGTVTPSRPADPNAPLTPITPRNLRTTTPGTPVALTPGTTPSAGTNTSANTPPNSGTTPTPRPLTAGPRTTAAAAQPAQVSAKLPQTGEASDKGLTALGLALLGSTLLPLAYFRRRKDS